MERDAELHVGPEPRAGIRADMVATVLEVARGEGEPVASGDVLLVLESMKMEIPVLAERAGRLTRLLVRPGDVVQEGDLLAVVEGR